MKTYFVKPNEKVNLSFLKENNYEGVYICASKGRVEDTCFDDNMELLKDSGLKVGFYHRFMAPDCKKNWTLESCKEGRAFGAAVRGYASDLKLAMDWEPCFFDVEDCEDSQITTTFYNALNGFVQKLDLYMDTPISKSGELLIRATEKQVEYLKLRKVHSKYEYMVK